MKEHSKAATQRIVLPVQELNNYLSCKICNGYFREAHSISECLHTFCKVCITSNLDSQPRGEKKCPVCSTDLKPPRLIYDRTIQAVVDKIFPHFVIPTTNNNHTNILHKSSTASSSSSTFYDPIQMTNTSGKRSRDKQADDNDTEEEVEHEDSDRVPKLAFIRVAPYPTTNVNPLSSSSSSSSSSSATQPSLPLPPLSKPLLKAADTVKVSLMCLN